ncbi:MAG: LysM peptidoglycan-binding domain-containing protein [Ilumatobacteraceae bacterium]
MVAGALVGLLPLSFAAPVVAGGPASLRSATRSVASATIGAAPRHSADHARPASAPAQDSGESLAATAPGVPGWSTYRVQRGDSVWSIAQRLAARGTSTTTAVADQIVEANRGRVMNDGRRFTTPALIEPGWDLTVPAKATVVPVTAYVAPGDEGDPGATTTAAPRGVVHQVVGGDSYWAIADAQLAVELGRRPADREILPVVHELIDVNAPLLGHRDPTLLLPGESVLLAGHSQPVDVQIAVPVVSPVAVPVELPVDLPVVSPVEVPVAAPVGVSVEVSVAAPAVSVEQSPVAGPSIVDASETAQHPGGLPANVGGVATDVPAALPVEVDVVQPIDDSNSAIPDHVSESAAPTVAATQPAPGTPVDDLAAVAAKNADRSFGMVGVGATTLLAAGALGVLESRRRQRLRGARVGARLEASSPQMIHTEVHLRVLDQPERLARLDLALRAAALDLADAKARVIAVQVSATGEIRLVIDNDQRLFGSCMTGATSAVRAATVGTAMPGTATVGTTTTPCGYRVDDDGDRLVPKQVTPGMPTPSGTTWRVDIADGSWVLPARIPTEALAEQARRAGMPCPALVQLGETSEGQLFVDLEALGVLAVLAPDEVGRGVVVSLASSLLWSPFAAAVRVVAVNLRAELGDGLDGCTTAVFEHAESIDAGLQAASEALGTIPTLTRGTNTFALRARSNGGEAWEPAVLFVGGSGHAAPESGGVVHDSSTGQQLLPTAVGRGLAVVVNGDLLGARFRLEADGDQFVLQPLGIQVVPRVLGGREVAEVSALLATADVPLDYSSGDLAASTGDGNRLVGDGTVELVNGEVERPVVEMLPSGQDGDVEPLPESPVSTLNAPFVEPTWSMLVRVLGPVEATSYDGVPASFERSKALELVVWLSQHRRRSTRTGARTALWDLDVRDATFANVVSDARRAMARADAPPEGQEWIGRTLTEELPLHELVVTDADLLSRRVLFARALTGAAAIEVLRPGLELVGGMPFAGTSYLWPDAEGITSSLTLLVVNAAVELANHYLSSGDAEGVFWATGQGLKVLAGHEELIALRMRAHARAGDLAGVRQEWAAYERALNADAWAATQPSPKLVAVRRELLAPIAAGDR